MLTGFYCRSRRRAKWLFREPDLSLFPAYFIYYKTLTIERQ
ncbi:MAG TPA: hypothetical protein VF721_20890 [Pyrinomonadaceae bacterium]